LQVLPHLINEIPIDIAKEILRPDDRNNTGKNNQRSMFFSPL
jgi:hypothetical protein